MTAAIVAAIRSLEQSKPAASRIIDDPWAKVFLQASRDSAFARACGGWLGAAIGTGLRLPPLPAAPFVLLRHRLIDDHIRLRISAGCKQVVILGAGWDSRAHRLGDAETVFFEVDHPSVSEAKQAAVRNVVGNSANVRYVTVDFGRQPIAELLVAQGFIPQADSVWVWEGVTYYLSWPEMLETLGCFAELAAPDATIIFDGWQQPSNASRLLLPASLRILATIGEPLRFWFNADQTVERLVETAGLDLVEHLNAKALSKRYRELGGRGPFGTVWVLALARARAKS